MIRLFLLVALSCVIGCGGEGRVECFPGTEWSGRAQACVRYIPEPSYGVTVTDNVPYAHESVDDILARGDDPGMADRVIGR